MAPISRRWKFVSAAGQQAHRVLTVFAQPALNAGIGDDRVEEAGNHRDDPLGPLGTHFFLHEVERAQRQRPHDLDDEVVARAEPAVQRDPIDAQLVGEHAHVDPFGREKHASAEAQRISCSGSGDHCHTCEDRTRVAKAGTGESSRGS